MANFTGADVNAADSAGVTPLEIACTLGLAVMIRGFILNGVTLGDVRSSLFRD